MLPTTILFFGFLFSDCNVFGLDLPSDIPQCSISNPELNDCIRDKANIAIPLLAKGRPELGVPVMSPVNLSRGHLEGKNLKITLLQPTTDFVKDVRLKHGLFDVKNAKAGFDGSLDVLTLTGDYVIEDGQIGAHKVHGKGKFNMTLVGNALRFRADVRNYEKDGEMYIQMVNSTMGLDTDRAYYSFENLQTPDKGVDIGDFVDKNWKLLRDELKASSSYLTKCSKSDPNLGECFKEKANVAIPLIVKGDPDFGIPSLSPVKVPVIEINTLNLTLFDVFTDDIKDLKITKAVLDFKNGKAAFTAYAKTINGLAENYTLTSGEVLGIPVSGHGEFRGSIEDATIDYKGDIRLYEKDGETYMELVNSSAVSDVGHASYYFENLKSPEKSDVNQFINENWRLMRSKMKPASDFYLNQFVNTPVKAIFSKVPLNKLFLS
ncbi:hypothetical protein Trydic_g9025 [Trypoxylus dichotomus]